MQKVIAADRLRSMSPMTDIRGTDMLPAESFFDCFNRV
jgi:hypothetical protein